MMKKRMKTQIKILLTALTLLYLGHASGQDSISHGNFYPNGISVEYGLGRYSLKDNYISDEKYSGTMPYFSLGWARKHNKYAYRLELEYRNSNEIKNFNVSTNITQFALNQGFLYPLEERKLFNKELNLYLGPTTELFFFYNEPNIAVDGFDYAQSYAALFSLGIDFTGIYQLHSKFLVESSIGMSALSLGFRMVDSEEDDQSPVKLLTLFSGLNSSFNLGIRYYVFDRLSIKAGYKFELCRINEWNPMISVSDNLLIGLTCHF
jgi:hypothetical protein